MCDNFVADRSCAPIARPFRAMETRASTFLSRSIGQLEKHTRATGSGNCKYILANASATVFASTAALEYYANELFIDHEKIFLS